MEYTQPEILVSFLNVFYMFAISIGVNDEDEPDTIGIKCNNYRKEISYTIQNMHFNRVVTTFVINISFHHVVLA